MWDFCRYRLRKKCVLLIEEDNEISAITSSVSELIKIYNEGGIDCPDDESKILYCSIFNVKMKCKTFKELMDTIEKIVADCC